MQQAGGSSSSSWSSWAWGSGASQPKEDNTVHNADAIIEFKDEPSAQIKAYDGKLGKADGSSWAAGYLKGTQFPGTVAVFDQTISNLASTFGSKVNDLDRKVRVETNLDALTGSLRSISDSLHKEQEVLEGLKRVRKVYTEKGGKDYHGLKELNGLISKTEATLKSHETNFKQVAEKVKERISRTSDESSSLLNQSMFIPERTFAEKRTSAPSQGLTSYCRKYNPEISSSQAMEMITLGRDIVKAVRSGELTRTSQNSEEAQKELAAVTWYLMSFAIAKGQGFQEGSFVVEDPDARLYNFLNSAPDVGERASSHYIGRSPVNNSISSYIQKSALHKGVDVLNGQMPANKRTIDFALVDKFEGDVSKNDGFVPVEKEPERLLFIKPENYSPFPTTANGYDALMHLYEYRESLSNKTIKGADDQPGMQKERVPSAALDAFQNLLNYIKGHQEEFNIKSGDISEIEKEAKLWGVAYMAQYVEELAVPNPEFDRLIDYVVTNKEYFQLSRELSDSLKSPDDIKERARLMGPTFMTAIVHEISQGMYPEDFEEQVQQFKMGLEQRAASKERTPKFEELARKFGESLVGLDHLSQRTGREVFISRDELG